VRVPISVVIPTFNRPQQLRSCLAALAGTKYPRDHFEVVVVDDGGTANLEPIIDGVRGSMQIRLARQPNRGPAAARNHGAALAGGALLAFTDDDCLPDPDWLPALARRTADQPEHLIGGSTINVLESNPFSAASQHLVSYLYEYSEKQRSNPHWTGFFASNNLAVPAAGFTEIGGFDTGFPLAAGEDRDFCDRWAAAGRPATFEPDARMRHAHRLSLASYWRQHWNYGRGAFHYNQARARRGAPPLRPQPPSFYVHLLRYPFSQRRSARAALEAGLLALSQCANALGYFAEKRARRAGPAPST
jgi:GT2 family glycosyltransferase